MMDKQDQQQGVSEALIARANGILTALRELPPPHAPEDGQEALRVRQQIMAAIDADDADVLAALVDSAERWVEAQRVKREKEWAAERERQQRTPGIYGGQELEPASGDGIFGGVDFLDPGIGADRRRAARERVRRDE